MERPVVSIESTELGDTTRLKETGTLPYPMPPEVSPLEPEPPGELCLVLIDGQYEWVLVGINRARERPALFDRDVND